LSKATMPQPMQASPLMSILNGIRGAGPRTIIVLLTNICIRCNLQCPDSHPNVELFNLKKYYFLLASNIIYTLNFAMNNILHNRFAQALILAALLFSIGLISALFRVTVRVDLGNILTLIGWGAALSGAWWVAKRQLVLRQRSSAVKDMMKSNREISEPLGKLTRIVSFEDNDPTYYIGVNSQNLFNDLVDIHNKIRILSTRRTQIWEEYRIALMPTENYFLFVKYLIEDLREDLYDALQANKNIGADAIIMKGKEYIDYLNNNFRFNHLQSLCIDVAVFSLDYGNLFKEKIPSRKPLNNSKILSDYNTRELLSKYQNDRDEYFRGRVRVDLCSITI
jgi:hypothetical protein